MDKWGLVLNDKILCFGDRGKATERVPLGNLTR